MNEYLITYFIKSNKPILFKVFAETIEEAIVIANRVFGEEAEWFSLIDIFENGWTIHTSDVERVYCQRVDEGMSATKLYHMWQEGLYSKENKGRFF